MRRAASILASVAIVAMDVASIGLAAAPASAQASLTQQLRRQQQLLVQQQRQIKENQEKLDAQRRDLARQGAAGPPLPTVSHSPFGDCPVGFTYFPLQGCQADGAVIIYDKRSPGGR